MVTRHAIATLLSVVLLSLATIAGAQTKADHYNRSAKQAFKAGQYEKAAYLLRQAMALEDDKALHFNLGRVYHLKYTRDRKQEDLRDAIGHYRKYLVAYPTRKKALEATQYLSILEPQVVEKKEAPEPPPKPVIVSRTGIVVATSAEGAIILLDGQARSRSPLVAEVAPGEHVVQVTAPGYLPVTRTVRVVKGAEVALDIPLSPRPGLLSVTGPVGATVTVDGTRMGELPLDAPLALNAGSRFVAVTQNGALAYTTTVTFARGQAQTLHAELHTTTQRYAAWGTFAAAGVGIITGLVLTTAAVSAEDEATALEAKKAGGSIDIDEADAHDAAAERRDRFRTAAIATLGLSAAVFGAGIFLYAFDEPVVTIPRDRDENDGSPAEPDIEIGALPMVSPTTAMLSVEVRF